MAKPQGQGQTFTLKTQHSRTDGTLLIMALDMRGHTSPTPEWQGQDQGHGQKLQSQGQSQGQGQGLAAMVARTAR